MRTLRWLHRWLGLLLAVPLILQGLSGTILTLEPVLPDLGHDHLAIGTPQPANAVLAAATKVAPSGTHASRYVPPAAPDDAAMVQFSTPGTRGGTMVRVDPVSLDVLGVEQGERGAMAWIRAFHASLLLQSYAGHTIPGWLGIGLLLLAVLGIPLWWPAPGQVRSAFTIAPKATGLRFHRRLHGAVGIWSVLLLLATSATGILLGFPQTARSVLGLQAGQPPRGGRAGGVPDLDAILAAAQAAAPDTRVRVVLLAEPVRVMAAPEGSEGIARLVTLAIDPKSHRVLSVQDPRTLSTAELALRWAHDIHYGQGLGPVWRGLTVVTGLVLPVFAVTGAAMWLIKRRRRARLAPQRAAAIQAAGE